MASPPKAMSNITRSHLFGHARLADAASRSRASPSRLSPRRRVSPGGSIASVQHGLEGTAYVPRPVRVHTACNDRQGDPPMRVARAVATAPPAGRQHHCGAKTRRTCERFPSLGLTPLASGDTFDRGRTRGTCRCASHGSPDHGCVAVSRRAAGLWCRRRRRWNWISAPRRGRRPAVYRPRTAAHSIAASCERSLPPIWRQFGYRRR